jgi:hypothetical protein
MRAASIDTRAEQRDQHLKSPDFLDVDKYADVTFKSTKVEGEKDHFSVTGDFTIRGVTRPITLDVTFEGTGKDPWGGTRSSFHATGKFDRWDYGLTWNVALETGGDSRVERDQARDRCAGGVGGVDARHSLARKVRRAEHVLGPSALFSPPRTLSVQRPTVRAATRPAIA